MAAEHATPSRQRRQDLAGRRFGRLTVLRFHEIKEKRTYWLCRCDCGAELSARADAMKQGRTLSCGCLKADQNAEYEDLAGHVFGRLTVLRFAGKRPGRKTLRWWCRCECGTERDFPANNLRSGKAQSCGCLHRERASANAKRAGYRNRRHGMSGTVEHATWHHIKQRCYDPNIPSYEYYGARGIRVCQRWLDSFEAFFADMGPRPGPEYTIERKDSNGDYCPENCRWATQKEQQRNKRNNVRLTAWGETLCVVDWAARFGVHRNLIYRRLKMGWSPEAAISTPPIPRGQRLNVPDSVRLAT